MPLGLMKLEMGSRYVHNWHLRLLNDKLMDVAEGKITRLMVFMPPRHAKSSVVSHYFAAWFLGNNPDKRVILSSYEADFAASWGRKVRDTLERYGRDVYGVSIREDNSASNRWEIDKYGGGMNTAGVGGSITGKGADLLIIDDPIKNAEEANSKTLRDKAWDWYKSTAYTRLEPGGRAILIQTRWHEDDLAGRILKEMESGGEQWELISLPAVAEQDEYYEGKLVRHKGEALWPARYDVDKLKEMEKTLGSYWWAALYQQRPAPEEGSMIKRNWWKFYKELPGDIDEYIQSWDMAFTGTDQSDYVVGQVWARKGANKYLVDQVRDKLDFPSTIAAVKALSAKYPQAYAKIVEDKANGPAVIQYLKDEIPGLIPYTPQGSKVARVAAVSAEIEAGNVYLPENAPWVNDFIEECAAFPNGLHDDQVDAMTQALIRLRGERVQLW